MPKILRNLRIDEVSTVNRGAGVGAQIMFSKRDMGGRLVIWKDKDGERRLMIPNDQVSLIELAAKADAAGAEVWIETEQEGIEEVETTKIISIAKALADGSMSTTTLTKGAFYAALVAGGDEVRKAEPELNLSREQAFVRFLKTDAGRVLYEAHRTAPADPPLPAVEPIDVAKVLEGSAVAKLRAKAEVFRKTDDGRGLSSAQAYTRVIAMPENRELFQQAKIDGLRAVAGAA